MTIKAVLFDLDDTLLWDDRSVDESFDRTCEEASRIYPNINPAELKQAVMKEARELYQTFNTFKFTKMIGINAFEALWGHFTGGELAQFREMEKLAPGYRTEAWTRALQAVGIKDRQLGEQLGLSFAATRRTLPYVYEETYSVLDELKGKYKLLLLTNGSPDLQQEKLDMIPQMSSYFDHIIISGQFGEGKPASSIFQYAMSLLEIKAEEGIMVGDKLTTDIAGSNGVGMTNAWINRKGMSRSDEIVPKHEINHLHELIAIIDHLNG